MSEGTVQRAWRALSTAELQREIERRCANLASSGSEVVRELVRATRTLNERMYTLRRQVEQLRGKG